MAFSHLFDATWLEQQFPPEKTDAFFDALFGDAEEGAYTISLRFVKEQENTLEFAFDLRQRSDRCLVCSLTYGLPQVFSRHPIINAQGIANAVAEAIGKPAEALSWRLAPTQEHSNEHHSIPLVISWPN